MEIRVYKNLEARSKGNSLFVARVACVDVFSYKMAVEVFKAVYGECVIEFLVV